MDYIKSYNQINEELKRTLSPARLKKQREDEDQEILAKTPADLFTADEMRDLNKEDFTIQDDKKEAKCVEKYHTFVIKKSLGLNDEVVYTLIVTNNKDGKVEYERKINVTKRSQHRDTLDFMLDKCAYIIHNMKEKAMKELDPYGEESWEESEKDKIIARRAGVLAEPEIPKEEPKKKKTGRHYVVKLGGWKEVEEDEDEDEDIYKGKKKKLVLPEIPVTDEQLPEEEKNRIECPVCGGTGEIVNMDDEVCDECGGDGKIDGHDCDECDGSGYVEVEINEPCEECGGSGFIEEKIPKKRKKKTDTKKKVTNWYDDLGPLPAYTTYEEGYEECPHCGGTGKGHYYDCGFCHGTGTQKSSPKKIKITGLGGKKLKEETVPKASKSGKKYKEIECYICKGWGTVNGKECYGCSGTGRRKVDADYEGPTWSIGGASDITYGS